MDYNNKMSTRTAASSAEPHRVRRAVFLDRDGTLIKDVGYIREPEKVELLPGVPEGLGMLQAAGFDLLVVSNQSGLARGYFDMDQLQAVHRRFVELLERFGIRLTDSYYCPFHPEGSVRAYRKASDLRKPAPGMLLRAAAEHGLDLPSSWLIGDSRRDVAAGAAAGTRTIKLPSAHELESGEDGDTADCFAENMIEAGKMILRQLQPCSRTPGNGSRANRSAVRDENGGETPDAGKEA